MDLQQEWNKLQETNLAAPPLPEAEILAALQQRSRAPLAGVERVIKFRLYAVVAYLLLALAFLLFNWNYPEKFPIASIVLGYYVVALVFSAGQLWHLRRHEVGMDGDLLHTLEAYYRIVKNSLRIDAIAGWFIYPMSFALGFFYALIRPDRGVVEVLQTPKFFIPLFLGMLIVTPLFWWFTRIINRKMFGNLMTQLEENIEELSGKDL
ncbi:MAG TPA: hypothetical protein PLC89_27055 [Haliscomenobacter sp.]|uniref:Transmembrane protein n=1 Tax=Haliscomenobacter hydrossis (strain ATCC 27775 / DSM 1100 / LMG 10767 / O) TaxID=760192 RepID=F4KRW9_HALH1|nr:MULTISPECIES: hypothetical protein [Haliscomenobacter]AEE51056.1 hypothetical protein Halhy_3195 [Haliscomenobacter hydrossis DSM 1100]HOY21001.1 hypothetical protein [Haliscomenobacter sp.]